MGIFGAMNTAVSGLRAQSYALENISGNIANSQTVGFKRVETSFVDLIPDSVPSLAKAGSTMAFSRLTNTIQGGIVPTNVDGNMAINGDGYFVVSGRIQPQDLGGAASQNLFTRRGDFTVDKDGRLVNGAGYYLKGYPVNPDGSVSTAGRGSVLTLPRSIAANATTRVTYAATLPQTPAGVGLLDPAYSAATPASPGPTVPQAGASAFLNQSIAGGSIALNDAQDNVQTLELRWGKVANADPTDPATRDIWNLFYAANAVTEPAWQNVGVPFSFDAGGTLTPSIATVPLGNLTLNGIPFGAVDLTLGAEGLRQMRSQGGSASVSELNQNGRLSGELDSVKVTPEGTVYGTFSNSSVVPLALVDIVRFNGDDFLKRLDGGAYEETGSSGPPISGYPLSTAAGGLPRLSTATLVDGHVESSNTDIADEFSKMIVTQQAYSASTRVLSISQDMMRETIGMIR